MFWKYVMYNFTPFLFFFVVIVQLDYSSAIQCCYFNETETPSLRIPCDKPGGSEECAPEHHCYALWANNTNTTEPPVVRMMGCFLGSGGECLGEELCVDRGKLRKDGLLFCCCKKDRCNEDFAWKPTPPPPEIKELPPKTYNIVTILTYIIVPLFFVLCLIIMYLRRQKIFHFKKIPLVDQHLPSPAATKVYRIELREVIAQGKFGSVRRAINLDKSEVVAVKIMSIQEKKSWLTEQKIYQLPLMDHENILRFIGAEKHGDNLYTQFWLITEFHKLGSLHDFLKQNTVSWEQLCKIAYTMARGLTHLHEEIPSERPELYKPAIAHRDFKSSNVLLKSDLTVCIADFGLALVFRPSTSCGDTHGQVGTRRYMAPEVLEGAINFSRDAFLRIDMYACGLVLWEIASSCPVQGLVPEYKLPFEAEVGPHPTLEDIQDVVVHKKLRPKIQDVWRKIPEFQILCDTIEECWDHDAEARLSASCVMERIPF